MLNMLYRLIITFPPRSKSLNFVAAVTIYSDFGAPQNKIYHGFHFSLQIFHEVMEPDVMILIFLMLNFKPVFFFTHIFFHPHQYALYSSLLSAIRVVPSAYLRFWYISHKFPSCELPSLIFCRMYPSYHVKEQVDNIQPWHTPYPIWNQFTLSHPFLTIASWLAYKVSQEMRKMVWYSHLLKNFPQFVVFHTVKDFSLVNEAEVDFFLSFSCIFYYPTDVGNLILGSSAFSKSSLYIWKFSVHVLWKPSLKEF